ncbi:endonuclease/exonuclease/phosphatase family protein [Actinomyces viscosus]|uniref:Uncharacterized protein conserved in bacteria n=1 Tax=Actinomyces viscosus TaxID=1656 RepID=A0A448PM18_ACTVI|nr:endonuclease/exonuclease/phosphatase family protein [Actinomyces viscosus]TFH52649.1 endonuclease/exonuclease/phosphatase family protein [Actinomyces viscosus]VEI16864.1 Uncharacterized protein conserved in bacteria [Actinomyces viscosus]
MNRRRQILRWIPAGVLIALALASLFLPTTALVFAQLIAMRSLLALGAVLTGVAFLVAAGGLWCRARRRPARPGERSLRAGLRTGVVGLVLLLVAGAHGGVLLARGVRESPVNADGTSAIGVLSLNTEREGADIETVAGLADDAGVDVVVLPETTQRYGQQLAEALKEASSAKGGETFAVFSASGIPPGLAEQGVDVESDPAYSTTVLVSSRLGEYRQVQGPTDTGFGAVRLEPADGDGPVIVGAHTYPPVPGAMAWWRSSVAGVTSLCSRPPGGLIVAGDLNATRDHAPLRDLGGCASAGEQAGIGGLATWPSATGTSWLGATIDHVLVDDGAWRGSGGRVVTVSGTDHRAVVVRLVADAS